MAQLEFCDDSDRGSHRSGFVGGHDDCGMQYGCHEQRCDDRREKGKECAVVFRLDHVVHGKSSGSHCKCTIRLGHGGVANALSSLLSEKESETCCDDARSVGVSFGHNRCGEQFGNDGTEDQRVREIRQHRSQDNLRAKTSTFEVPTDQNTTKIPREDPQREKKSMKIVAGKGTKRAKFWAVWRRPVRWRTVRWSPNPNHNKTEPHNNNTTTTTTTQQQQQQHNSNDHRHQQQNLAKTLKHQNWPKLVWPKSVKPQIGQSRSKNWPKSDWPK